MTAIIQGSPVKPEPMKVNLTVIMSDKVLEHLGDRSQYVLEFLVRDQHFLRCYEGLNGKNIKLTISFEDEETIEQLKSLKILKARTELR